MLFFCPPPPPTISTSSSFCAYVPKIQQHTSSLFLFPVQRSDNAERVGLVGKAPYDKARWDNTSIYNSFICLFLSVCYFYQTGIIKPFHLMCLEQHLHAEVKREKKKLQLMPAELETKRLGSNQKYKQCHNGSVFY